jgi:hypothetical protein
MLGHEPTDFGPQGNQHFLLESAVELLELRGHEWLPRFIYGGQTNRRFFIGHNVSVSPFCSKD